MKKLLIVAILTMMASTSYADSIGSVNEFNRWSKADQSTYLTGLIGGVWFMEPAGYQCGPGDQTKGQNIAIFRKYIDNHPEKWTYTIESIYLLAIREAYHCEALPKSKI